MLNLKNTLTAALVIASNLAFANSWEVGVNALYFQPSFAGNGLGYSSYNSYAGADNSQVILSVNGANPINNIDPKWNFGFRVEGGFQFSPTSDLNVNWSRLHETVDGHLPAGSLFSGSLDGFYAAELDVNSRWDAVNFELGKQLQFSKHTLVRLHAGMAFARIKNTFTSYPKVFANSNTYFISKDTLTYSGFGPRTGFDFHYLFDSGFGLYGKTAASILVGTAKQNISGFRDYSNTIYGLIPFGIPNFNVSNSQVVVPQLEASLGITYDQDFDQGSLGLNVGYVWMNYLSAISSYTGVGIVGSSLGIPATTNFNLNGVIAGFSWQF